MPNIKNQFTGGKMNKDVDERLVPKGEYRDAMNIQVSTSEGSDVGTVQNILGNVNVPLPFSISYDAMCVGSIADEKNDTLYWFVREPLVNDCEGGGLCYANPTIIPTRDIIFRHKGNSIETVFVDIKSARIGFYLQSVIGIGPALTITSQEGFNAISIGDMITLNIAGCTPGTQYTVLSKEPNGFHIDIGDYSNQCWVSSTETDMQLTVQKPGVLKFPNKIITGIDIIDDMLFWTDGETEPKKINIPRSIDGTEVGGGLQSLVGLHHTLLIGPINQFTNNPNNSEAILIKEEHITVIRRAPKNSLSMELISSRENELNYSGVVRISDVFNLGDSDLWAQRSTTNANWPYDFSEVSTEEGSNIIYIRIRSDLSGNTNFDLDAWEIGSKVVLKEFDTNGNLPQIPINDYTLKGTIIPWPWQNQDANSFTSTNAPWGCKVAIKVSSISRTPRIATTGTLDYVIDLFDEEEKLFEFKFPRFSYRYKYLDGEYSTYAPWTSVAFLSSSFDFHPKKGYNLGMVNQTKIVYLRDFISDLTPKDVVEIDILYKDDASPNIYLVDTLSPLDDNTYTNPTLSPGVYSNNWYLNELKIDKENVEGSLPSNQLLRPWDNVPRKALAQGITGNRLVYGNYTQNYDLHPSKIQYNPQIFHNLIHDTASPKSIKSLREYQLGVVFTDKYGRETPVLTSSTGIFSVEKDQGINKNKIQTSILNTTTPQDMEYFRFYIKETSGEYYNMAMDRWYDARDGNIWASFNSADRNKVDIDSFLILKKGVDSDELVKDPARFKVIAIENEAPDFIKITRTVISDKQHKSSIVNSNIFLTGTDLPKATSKSFSIAYYDGITDTHIYSNSVVKDIHNRLKIHPDEEFYFQIVSEDGFLSTEPLKIVKIDITENDFLNSADVVKFDIVLEEEFGIRLNKFTDDTTGANSTKIIDGNRAVFWSYKKENKPEFDGKFFVKLYEEDVFTEYIINNTTEEVTTYNEVFEQKIYSFLYSKHSLVWNGASGTILNGSSDYHVSIVNSGNDPQWDDYITITNTLAQDGSSGYSTDNWRICAAFFRGININKAKDTSTDFGEHGMDKRKGFESMDIHDDATTWDFEDVWFIDGAESQGEYNGHWNGSPNSNNVWRNGIVGNKMELGFGGIQPKLAGFNTWQWAGNNSGYSTDKDFYDLEDNDNYSSDSEGYGLAKEFSPGTTFRWVEDPTKSIYRIDDIGTHNAVRHEDGQYNKSDNYKAAVHSTNVGGYLIVNDIKYCTSLFYRPDNHSRNYDITFSNELDPTGTLMPWDPYTYGPILNGVNIPLTTATALTNGNEIEVTSLLGTDAIYGLMSIKVGMVCTQIEAIVSKIVGTTLYFKNYNPNNVNPTISAISSGATINFRQYGMNGISRNSAKNINYWNSARGFNDTNMGVDAVGYTIEIVEPHITETMFPRFPAVFETEPKDNTDLDIYYGMTDNTPIYLSPDTISHILPVGAQLSILADDPNVGFIDGSDFGPPGLHVVSNDSPFGNKIVTSGYLAALNIVSGDTLIVNHPNGNSATLEILDVSLTTSSPIRTVFELKKNLLNQRLTSSWFNCYSFGNGVESNRIRDNFNKPYISNGIKASTTAIEPYGKEHRKYGLIYSGLYNSTSGVNNLNQFITAEKITKDINPIYGSIQKLHAGWGQSGDLVALCEDRILKILANKDALFNADGNTNVTSTNKVLGTATPYSGEYGISKNPESFASEAYRLYFTDKVRGTVMRLSRDGLTPISMHGMKDWFRDNLKLSNKLIGSYDDKKDEYNITLTQTREQIAKTVTFREDVKGWVSFKSFVPENAISCANEYFSFNKGKIWKHHDESVNRNTFYGIFGSNHYSTFNVILNEVPGSVKSFATINYEGSQSKVDAFLSSTTDDYGNTIPSTTDNQYYNLSAKPGWYVDSIFTNKESGSLEEFIEKEGKWFNYIKGKNVQTVFDNQNTLTNILIDNDGSSSFDQASFAIQGLGVLGTAPVIGNLLGCTDPLAFNYYPGAVFPDPSNPCCYGAGCTDPAATNYDPNACIDDNSCVYAGCTNPNSTNYNPLATIDDGSCITTVLGCTDPTAFNYNSLANTNDPNNPCVPFIYGCMNPNALNYNSLANTDDFSCTYIVFSCLDPAADNYVHGAHDCNGDPIGTQNPGWDSCCTYSCNWALPDGTYPVNGSHIYTSYITDETVTGANDGAIAVYIAPNTGNYSPPMAVDNGSGVLVYGAIKLLDNTGTVVDHGGDFSSGVYTFSNLSGGIDYHVAIYANANNTLYTTPGGWGAGGVSTTSVTYPACVWNSFVSATSWPITVATSFICGGDGCKDDGTNPLYPGRPSGFSGAAYNYDPTACNEDGSCCYINGCMDPTALNYNPNACHDDASCCFVGGCTNINAVNYNSNACYDDGSCLSFVYGCMDSRPRNDLATDALGALIPAATNYDPLATVNEDPNTGLDPCTYNTDVSLKSPALGSGAGNFFYSSTTDNWQAKASSGNDKHVVYAIFDVSDLPLIQWPGYDSGGSQVCTVVSGGSGGCIAGGATSGTRFSYRTARTSGCQGNLTSYFGGVNQMSGFSGFRWYYSTDNGVNWTDGNNLTYTNGIPDQSIELVKFHRYVGSGCTSGLIDWTNNTNGYNGKFKQNAKFAFRDWSWTPLPILVAPGPTPTAVIESIPEISYQSDSATVKTGCKASITNPNSNSGNYCNTSGATVYSAGGAGIGNVSGVNFPTHPTYNPCSGTPGCSNSGACNYATAPCYDNSNECIYGLAGCTTLWEAGASNCYEINPCALGSSCGTYSSYSTCCNANPGTCPTGPGPTI